MTANGWQARLDLRYRLLDGRCVAQDRHVGPLRVLKPLYPEGPGICHHVLVHPPGGLVAGDDLRLQLRVEAGAHALLTTPGATRFYRSDGALAAQQVELELAAGARLEWLPMETIAHPGCQGLNRVQAHLAPGAEMIGWDLLALGLPASGRPFQDGTGLGSITQHLCLSGAWGPAAAAGRWLDLARVRSDDAGLLQSPLGWAGQTVLGTLWFASGAVLPAARRDALLDAARDIASAHLLAPRAGCTSPQPGVVVLRLLAPKVEPAMQMLRQVRAAWRGVAWRLGAAPPRIWGT